MTISEYDVLVLRVSVFAYKREDKKGGQLKSRVRVRAGVGVVNG